MVSQHIVKQPALKIFVRVEPELEDSLGVTEQIDVLFLRAFPDFEGPVKVYYLVGRLSIPLFQFYSVPELEVDMEDAKLLQLQHSFYQAE